MAKPTIAEQYQELKEAREAEALRIATEYFGGLPEAFYKPGGEDSNYQPYECKVLGVITAYTPGIYFEKRPTRLNLEALHEADPPTIENIRINLKQDFSFGSSSWAEKIDGIGTNVFRTVEEAKVISEERRKLYQLGPDQFRCAQCGKATDNSAKVVRRIISRQYPGFGKEFDHCSDQCGLHNQFAHEG